MATTEVQTGFPMRTVKQWHSLSKEVVQSLCLFSRPKVFKTQLELWATWSDLKADPAVNRGLDWRSPELPSSLNYFVIL